TGANQGADQKDWDRRGEPPDREARSEREAQEHQRAREQEAQPRRTPVADGPVQADGGADDGRRKGSPKYSRDHSSLAGERTPRSAPSRSAQPFLYALDVILRRRYSPGVGGLGCREYTDEFEAWWETLTAEEQERVSAAVELLEERGP